MKLLFINPSIRPDSPTIHLPVGLGSVMTYFDQNGYDFDLLDIDLHSYNDDYVENYLSNNTNLTSENISTIIRQKRISQSYNHYLAKEIIDLK